MTRDHWAHLMADQEATLTEQEMSEGWHWCNEFDGLLVGPGMMEKKFCSVGAGCPANLQVTHPRDRPEPDQDSTSRSEPV